MGANTKIQWCDHTFNPWIGCTKVSPACEHCYAAEQDKFRRWTQEGFGKGKPRRRTNLANWKLPLKWNNQSQAVANLECDVCGATGEGLNADGFCHQCELKGSPIRPSVFCGSLCDWLDDEVPIEWLADLLGVIYATPNLDWLLLTKRPENWSNRICEAMVFLDRNTPQACNLEAALANPTKYTRSPVALWVADWLEGKQRSNVWIGTTVENQEMADARIPALLEIPAKVRFLSCEPLLEPVALPLNSHKFCPDCKGTRWSGDIGPGIAGNCEYSPCDSAPASGIDWVICGGESGHDARAMHPAWARSLRDQCKAAGVPFFFKQWGEWKPTQYGGDGSAEFQWAEHGESWQWMCKVGKKASGRLLDGVEHNEFPVIGGAQ